MVCTTGFGFSLAVDCMVKLCERLTIQELVETQIMVKVESVLACVVSELMHI